MQQSEERNLPNKPQKILSIYYGMIAPDFRMIFQPPGQCLNGILMDINGV